MVARACDLGIQAAEAGRSLVYIVRLSLNKTKLKYNKIKYIFYMFSLKRLTEKTGIKSISLNNKCRDASFFKSFKNAFPIFDN